METKNAKFTEQCPKCKSGDIDEEYDFVTKEMSDVCQYYGYCLRTYEVSPGQLYGYANDEDE